MTREGANKKVDQASKCKRKNGNLNVSVLCLLIDMKQQNQEIVSVLCLLIDMKQQNQEIVFVLCLLMGRKIRQVLPTLLYVDAAGGK